MTGMHEFPVNMTEFPFRAEKFPFRLATRIWSQLIDITRIFWEKEEHKAIFSGYFPVHGNSGRRRPTAPVQFGRATALKSSSRVAMRPVSDWSIIARARRVAATT